MNRAAPVPHGPPALCDTRWLRSARALRDRLVQQGVHVLRVALVAATVLAAGGAPAADFPLKPVRLVVPYPAGGTMDLVARLVAAQLRETWRQPVIVENRVGGNGAVGVEHVMRSPPDGYTLLVNGTPLLTVPYLQPTAYVVSRDLVPVVATADVDFVLAASNRSGITSLADLLERARQAPGRLNYGSGGNGSLPHLDVELLKSVAAINLTHVPYKGNALALQALMAGEVDLIFDATSSIIPLARSGKVRPLLIAGRRPIEALPGVPIFDAVYPGSGIDAWHGIFAPVGLPADRVQRIAADVAAVVQSPEVSQRLREMGFEPSGTGPAEFSAIVRRDDERWGRLLRTNAIRAD